MEWIMQSACLPNAMSESLSLSLSLFRIYRVIFARQIKTGGAEGVGEQEGSRLAGAE